jgi:hypothetical protein
MEAMVAGPVEDGQQRMSPTEIVSNVLPRSSLFYAMCLQEKLNNTGFYKGSTTLRSTRD